MRHWYFARFGWWALVVAICWGFYANAQPPASDQAVAPPEIIAPTVADIPKGTQATVSPEALIIDDASKVWLNKHVPVGGETGVIIYHLKDGTYEVEVKDEKARWLKVPLTEDLKKSLVPVKTLHLTKAPPKK